MARDDQDAELNRLFAEWLPLARRESELDVVIDDIRSAVMLIEPPEALFARGLPESLDGIGCEQRRVDGRWWHADRVQEFRTTAATKWGTDEHDQPVPVPNARGQARRAEIVTAYDAWQAEIGAYERSVGYPAIDQELTAIEAAGKQLRLQIARIPASTLRGVAIKARVAMWCRGEKLADTDRDLAAGSANDVTMYNLVMLDLLRLDGETA